MSEFEKIKNWKHTYYGEPIVILSLDEAKKWIRILYDNAPYIDCLYECSKDDYFFLQEIEERIERSEGQNERSVNA